MIRLGVERFKNQQFQAALQIVEFLGHPRRPKRVYGQELFSASAVEDSARKSSAALRQSAAARLPLLPATLPVAPPAGQADRTLPQAARSARALHPAPAEPLSCPAHSSEIPRTAGSRIAQA